MWSRLDKTKSKGDKEAEKRILKIIDQEKQHLYWERLNFKMGKSKGRSTIIVTDEDDKGDTQEFGGKSNVEKAI